MEAILIFDLNNYLVYSNHNDEFLDEIEKIAIKNNLVFKNFNKEINKPSNKFKEELCNFLVLLLGPYVASVRILKENCPQINLFQNSKAKIIFKNYLEYIYLIVFEEQDQLSSYHANHKLNIFMSLTKFLYGVSIENLENDCDQKYFLEKTYKCWNQTKNCPSFKLNAIEKLIINKCIVFELEKILLSLMNEINEKPLLQETSFQSMIYVKNMLTCNYKRNSSPKILHSDFMLIALLVKTYFYSFSNTGEKNLINSNSNELTYSNDSFEVFNNIYNNLKINSWWDKNIENAKIKDINKYSNSLFIENNQQLFNNCDLRLIFIQSYIDRTCLIPLLIRLIKINNDIVFVSLSELPSTFLFYHTNKLLNLFNGLQYSNPKYFGFLPLNQLENSIKKLKICINFILNGNTKDKKKLQNIKTLNQKFDTFLKSDFRKFVLAPKNFELSSYLEALTGSICFYLKELVDNLVYTHHHNQIKINNNSSKKKMSRLKKFFLFELRDYLTFIWVKSRRNISIEPYRDLFPDLIMFFYIDRNTNEFIQTSEETFNIECCLKEENDENCFHELKSMIFTMIDKAYQLLKNGYMQSRWQENNYIFNYAIWFEDQNGKLLNCKDKSFKLNYVPSFSEKSFVEEIVYQCFPSFKLLSSKNFDENSYDKLNSQTEFSILKCYEIFFIQKTKNFYQENDLNKISNEEIFLAGNKCSNTFNLIQARRLGQKISETNFLSK